MGGSVGKIGGAIGGALGLGGGGAIGDATQAILKRQKQAMDYTKDQFGQTVQSYQPYLNAGSGAVGMQSNLLGLNGVDAQQNAYNNYMESPGQKWLREQGEKSLLRNAAAIGGLGGGNVRKGLAEYGIGLASQDFNNYYNRLAGLGEQGAGMTQGLGALRSNNAANVSNILTGMGESKASGIMGQYNNKQAGLGNLFQLGGAFSPGLGSLGGLF